MDEKNNNLRVAIAHDFLTDFGGAERVLEVMCEMFPAAPIYSLLYDKKRMRGKFSDKTIHTSFLQKFPKFLRKRKKWLLPLMPTAPEIFDLRDFDLVLSSSGAWSKGIVTRLNTTHIAYVHSPIRFAWDVREYLEQQKKGGAIRLCARLILNYIRVWDKAAADRPDALIANSKYTQGRIRKYYGRESVVIYPPVGGNFQFPISLPTGQAGNFQTIYNDQIFNLKNTGKYFLVVSRLSPYKKIDMVVEAFNKLELPLVVIGEGQQEKYLRSIAKDNVKILGYKSDGETAKYYAGACAFVFAGVDDFGIAPVEAMAHGVPVLAIRKGGVKEIVIEGKTGEFFDAATPEVIADGVRRLVENEKSYDKQSIISKAEEFSKERFVREFGEYIDFVISKSNPPAGG
ncbi:MAG: glycosyl transferase [Candidatus Moranbacteria bacterium CG23_combo_of_CG06-09_8_20_14_all_39_10]|nr:MAG: glycosyl transferase [Candidatus Moranbacteria bacterium CG23_combo_of_CG06-09_8_20_14_all_39_10]